MQPPPRKTKHSASHLKGIHSDQISKLQHKHQHEIDTLEDVRLFTKQRAAIEKEYAQSLCKLAQQYLSKGKFPPTPNIGSEDGQEYKTMSEVWRTVLDETDRVGKIRLQAADTYLQQISEPVKPIKTSKTTVAKKVFEQIKLLQKEIDQAVTELAKSQKVYNDDEHVSHEAVLKATEAESKVKNKSTGIFTSLAKLQQTSAKLNLRMENCQVKSTSARNEYLLNLAATNTHLERYFVSELPELVKLLDGEMYDKIRDFFITLSKMEVDCCGLTQERFMKILTDSTMVSRQFDHQCFLHTNTIFTDKVQYSFEPQENDQVSKVSAEHTAAEQLHAEARKWALRAARDTRTIRQLHVKIDNLKHRSMNGGSKSGSSEPSSPTTSPVDTDARLDELQIAARKADTSKRKAEARLAAMREGGIDTASAISSAQEEVDAEVDEGDESRPQSQSDAPVVPPTDSTYVNYQDDDYDDSYAATATTTAATAATDEADAATDATSQQQEGSLGYASLGQGLPLRAQALYDFVASNTDELDIKENETVDVIGDGDGDGWVQARNMSGKVGFVPQNYLQYTDTTNPDPSGPGVDPNEMNVDADQAPLSAGYGSAPPSAGYDATAPSTDTLGSTGAEKVSNYSSTDYEVQATIHPPTELNTGPPGSTWARALYDFEATSEEELSFSEGQLIRVTQKDENGVDDGWWRGELGGKVGVFPSLVVEELSKEEMSAQDLASPNRPGPPAFTPPEPGPPPPQLEVTQPTPSDESGPTMAESSTPNGVTPSPPQSPQPKCSPTSPTSYTQLTGHSPGRIESTV